MSRSATVHHFAAVPCGVALLYCVVNAVDLASYLLDPSQFGFGSAIGILAYRSDLHFVAIRSIAITSSMFVVAVAWRRRGHSLPIGVQVALLGIVSVFEWLTTWV